MYKGDYNFFDYKYNIIGYNGQDFGGFSQYLYLIISIVLITFLLILLRKSSKKRVLNIIRIIGIFLTLFYLIKTIWESIYDIRLMGSFNYGLLPFDTCSVVMIACLLAGFTKGKIKNLAECWLCTGSIVGGIGAMVVLNAFKYYPFFSFGAFYSMIWHLLMVFIGLLLIVTNYVKINYRLVLNGFLFHLIISLFVIPFDFIFDFDFMMYKELGSIPLFDGIGSYLLSINLSFINPVIMLFLYFLSFNLIYLIIILFKHKKNKVFI